MFRKEQLILIALLSGCATVANDGSVESTKSLENPIVVARDSSFLESIDSTLEMADDIMSEREVNKANTERKMFSLKQLVNQEEELIAELEKKLSIKDSIIKNKTEKLEVLTFQLGLTENKLSSTEEIIQRYIVAYNVLLEENNLLQTELDESYNQVDYLDSLIYTCKKLTKVYESN